MGETGHIQWVSKSAISGGLAGIFYGYEKIPSDWLEIIKKRDWIEKLCELEIGD